MHTIATRACILALVLLLALPIAVVRSEEQRHTPGFPYGLRLGHAIEDVEKLLSGGKTSVDEIGKAQEAVEDLENRGIASGELAEAVRGYGARDVDLEAEVEAIGDEGLRQLMDNLVEKLRRGDLTLDEVEHLFERVNSMREQGLISQEDYLRALKILRASALQLQMEELHSAVEGLEDPSLRSYLEGLLDQYRRGLADEDDIINELSAILGRQRHYADISGKDIETLINAIKNVGSFKEFADRADRRWLMSVGEILLNLYSRTGQTGRRPESSIWPTGFGRSSTGIQMPSIGMPSVSLPQIGSLLQLPISMLIAVAIAIAAAVAIALAFKLFSGKGVLMLIPNRRSARGVYGAPKALDMKEPLPKVVRLYWESVELLQGRLRLVKGASETHREFLSRIRPSLKGYERAFEEVTYSYELCRFGGVNDSNVERRAEEGFKALVKAS